MASRLLQFERKGVWSRALVIMVGLTVWALILPTTFAHNPWLYGWDAAAYLEAADSLHAGRGLYHRVIHGLGSQIWEPMTLWPPGQSIMTAIVMTFGVPAKVACVIVTVGSCALSIALLAHICLCLFRWYVAMPLVVVVAASSSFQVISTQCVADGAYYFWALASAACIVEWTQRPKASWRWMFAAGVFAGAAYCTRNAALAIFAATGLLLLLHLAWRSFGEVLKAGMIWAGGASVLALPLVIHNLASFGRINPYDMPPSELSLAENIERAISVTIGDMTTFPALATFASHKTAVVVLVVAVLLAVTVGLLVRSGAHRALKVVLERYRLPIFFLAYAAFSTAVIILGRTRYRWGEEISSRYMVQTYWALWICVVVWAAGALRHARLNASANALVISAALTIIAGLHLNDNAWKFSTEPTLTRQSLEARVGPAGCAALKAEMKPNQFVLATGGYLLRVHCDISARKLSTMGSSDGLRQPLTEEELHRAGADGRLWGLVIDEVPSVARGEYGPLVRDIVTAPERHPEFVVRSMPSKALVIQYVNDSR